MSITTTYYLDRRAIRTTEDPGFGDLINAVNLTQHITDCINSLGSSGSVNVSSPLTGNGAVGSELTFLDGSAANQVWMWNGSAWVLSLNTAGTFLGLTDVAPGSFTAGDIYYSNGTNIQALAAGTALYSLRMNAGATAPEWYEPVDSNITTGTVNAATANRTIDMGGFQLTLDDVTTFRVDAATSYILGDGAGGNRPTLDSDAAGITILTIDANGLLGRANPAAFGTLGGSGAPSSGTTTAWYDGQFYGDTASGQIYIATNPSGDPDSAATGSIWAALTSSSNITAGVLVAATADRTVDLGNFDLTFNNVDIFNLNVTNGYNLDVSSGSISLAADGAGETVSLLHSTGLTNLTVGETNISVNPSSTGAFIMGSNADPDTNISAPIDGMIIEDSTDNDIRAYTGGVWVSLLDTFNMADADQTLTGNRLHDTSTFNWTLSGQGDISLISTDGATDSARLVVGNNSVYMQSADGTNEGTITVSDTGAVTITGDGHLTLTPHTIVNNGAGTQLRFQEANTSNGVNYVGFQAPDNITANVTWTLPNADGTADQVLKTDGSSVLSWTDQAGGAATYAHISDLSFNLSNSIQTITNVSGNDWDGILGTAHIIEFPSPLENNSSGITVDQVDDRIEIVTAGIYKIDYAVSAQNTQGSAIKYSQLCLNGTDVLNATVGVANVSTESNSWVGTLAASDYIDIRGNSASSTGNYAVYGYAISIHLLEAT